jgi:GLPGLI family protein
MKNFSISSPDMTPEMNEKMRENMKKAFEKTYILSFTNFESLYQEEEKLNTPKPSSNGIKVEVAFSGGGNRSNYYKNLKTKKYLNEAEIFDKEFLIDDDLEVFNWTMVNEQKMIGNYTCYKAQIVIPVTAEEKKEFEEFKIKKEEGKTNFFIPMEPKDKIIEAWYTLDIPIPNGPREYWGLPGLILELHDGDTTLLCSKIILNPSEKIEIKIPKSGKKVTQKVFDEIEEKKMKSMMNEDGVIEIKMN